MQSRLFEVSQLVFDVLKAYSGRILLKESIEALLRTEDGVICKESHQISCFGTSSSTGYPEHPLYLKISRTLTECMSNRKSVLELGKNSLGLQHENLNKGIGDLVDLKLNLLRESWKTFAVPEKRGLILEILETLQLRGILDLLGMGRTIGSVNLFPPPVSVLWKSFKENHKPKSNLSNGARALSKHCHRDSTCQWWGVSTGSESDKNDHADRVLERILGDAVWINIHMLPHDLKILEVRNQLGYGARWSFDGKCFRGFLEPQMDDGHTQGWRH